MRRIGRRSTWIGIGAVAAIVALIPLGRIEASWAADEQLDQLEQLHDAVGGFESARLSDWWTTDAVVFHPRLGGRMTCLRYRFARDPYAVQLCFDAAGRYVEGVDGRTGTAKWYSIRWDPSYARRTMPPPELEALLEELRAAQLARIKPPPPPPPRRRPPPDDDDQ